MANKMDELTRQQCQVDRHKQEMCELSKDQDHPLSCGNAFSKNYDDAHQSAETGLRLRLQKRLTDPVARYESHIGSTKVSDDDFLAGHNFIDPEMSPSTSASEIDQKRQ